MRRSYVWIVAAVACFGQLPPPRVTPVAFDPDGLGTEWKVLKAELRESAQGVWGFLQVQNPGQEPDDELGILAEYFDKAGRLCLKLPFDIRVTSAEGHGPRELTGMAVGMGVSCTPVRVALQRLPNRGKFTGNPPIVFAGAFTPLDLVSPPEGDLLLASVHVNATGYAERVVILHSRSKAAESWLTTIFARRCFHQGLPGETLVLVRATSNPEAENPISPHETEWIRNYLRNRSSLPSLNVIMFFPKADGDRTLTLVSGGDGWGTDVLEWRWEAGRLWRYWRNP